MTNSYGSSQSLPRIVFIHGMNNNPQCFSPIMEHFRKLGFETELIILPGHGEIRKEAKDAKAALNVFTQRMKSVAKDPYVVIAFSHGALYLQLWLEKNLLPRPQRQVLLAPALYMRRHKLVERIIRFLPDYFAVISLAPKAIRRFEMMLVREYRILLHGMATFQKIQSMFRIPTLVLVDPKDELVDAVMLKKEIENRNKGLSVELFPRDYLKKGLGCHHVLFHPNYFSDQDWIKFTGRMEEFLKVSNS